MVNGKIYWEENDGSNSGIRRANVDGSGKETLIRTDEDYVHDVKLDLANGMMYWSGSPENTKGLGVIEAASLDGTGRSVIVSGLDKPTGIALDLRIPEPSSLTILFVGLLAVPGRRRSQSRT